MWGEEDEEDSADADTAARQLRGMGMSRREAREWASVHDAATVDYACQMTRRFARVHPTAYLRRCLEQEGVLRAECEPDETAAARVDIEERRRDGAEARSARRERWDAATDEERAEWLDTARQRAPAILRDRPADTPALMALALEAMAGVLGEERGG